MKDKCCPNTPTRKVARSIYESSQDVARSIATTPQYTQSRRDRKKVASPSAICPFVAGSALSLQTHG